LNPSSHTNPGSDTAGRRYSFSSRWRIQASRERVWAAFEELLATEHPFVWWPGMHSERRGGDDIHVVAGSPVGYRLRFRLHDIKQDPMSLVTLHSDGDLEGRATMRLEPVDDASSTIDVDWHVDVTRSWMRRTGFALRPLFVRAHDAVMRSGERGLNDWLLVPAGMPGQAQGPAGVPGPGRQTS
jgi:hypothetical protein